MKYELLININPLGLEGELLDEKKQSQQVHVAFAEQEFASSRIEMNHFLAASKAFFDQINLNLADDDDIQVVNFTSVVNGWLALDQDFKVLTPIMLGDNQDAHFIDALMMNGIGGQLQRKTGVPLSVNLPLILTLHVRNDTPDIYAQAKHYMTLQDYIVYHLLNQNITSEATAARTGFYNVETKSWDGQALALTGLETAQLPEITQHAELAGNIETDLLAKAISKATNFKIN